MAERLLYKNSSNLSALIHLMTIHEENTARYIRHQNANDTSIVNLLNNVFTHNQVDISGSFIHTNENRETLVYNDNSVNSNYIREMKYSDLSYCIYTTCPISRETFTDESTVLQLKSCRHYFKKEAVIPWLRQSGYCPYCRATIAENSEDDNQNIF